MSADELGYFAKQVAEKLEIPPTTLRRWSTTLEKEGYTFQRNQQGQRIYYERDHLNLAEMKKLINNSVSIVSAANVVISSQKGSAPTEWAPSDYGEVARPHARSLDEYVKKVADESAKKAVAETWQQIDKAIDAKLSQEEERRDRLLLKRLDEAMEQQRSSIAAGQEKKGFWSRLFKGRD